MTDVARNVYLAPLRGVTVRSFRETFAGPIAEAGFTAAVAPFIPANPGFRATDRLLADLAPVAAGVPVIPQVITRHPEALRAFLTAIRARGFARADLNAGCPFPMIVRRGRGSGLLKTPDLLEELLRAGCETLGPGCFSVKVRLGCTRPDELLALVPRLNRYPLACVTVHARTARQMYAGACDRAAFDAVAAACAHRVVYNGDLAPADAAAQPGDVMIGRAFVRMLGARPDAGDLLRDYIARSRAELCGERPVLGRMKELLAYWAAEDARWRRLWPVIKICRTVGELASVACR